MALTRPEQREWTAGGEASILFGLSPSESDLWIAGETEVEGWEHEPTFEDLPTAAGSAPGREVAVAMYPSLGRLHVEDPEALVDLETAKGSGVLTWWCPNRNLVATVDATLRYVIPSHDKRENGWPHRFAYVEWFIAKPGDITWDAP